MKMIKIKTFMQSWSFKL